MYLIILQLMSTYILSIFCDYKHKAINIYIHISLHKDTHISEGSISKSGVYGSWIKHMTIFIDIVK